jgi:hypothetical protein
MWGKRRASFDAAQDEVGRTCHKKFILILSEVAIRDAAERRLLMVRARTIDLQST